MSTDFHFERCVQCNEPLHFFQYISAKDKLGISLCSACEKTYRQKLPRATAAEHRLYITSLQEHIPATLQHADVHETAGVATEPLQHIVSVRVSNGLVNDRIAETVRSIRHLYDKRPHRKHGSRDQSGQMYLF
jgi:hypothetical protein